MKRHTLQVAVLWLILTALGELLAFGPQFLPSQYAEEAKVVDDAFMLLVGLAVPVFAFVVAVVVYSVITFRARADEVGDGPPIRTHRGTVATWLIVTGGLATFILINPGFVGLAAMRGEAAADMTIEVESQRWQWKITYPNGAVSRTELVLPVDERIRFDVTSVDILHSFWVPAFRTKIDAVPGRTTRLYVTPTKTGSYEDDPGMRLQCAELCGFGHGRMAIPVRVLPQPEFESWLNSLAAEQESEG